MKLSLTLLKPFLGLELEIINSTDPTLIGKKGLIVFESRNMFGILLYSKTTTKNKIIYVAKDICIFKIKLSKKRVIIVNGKELVNRFMKLRKYGRKRR